ncbi:hypothetical protein M3Y94_00461100 [Aphelenchoides besseyi]|nr:hypothetical protein M3Y94_00461100 [Aphelenchoides besseyi]
MGNIFAFLQKPSGILSTNQTVEADGSARTSGFPLNLLQSRKRKSSDDTQKTASSPAKVIKLNTPNYIYRRLFVDGCDSDITVTALDNEWKLHRVYLEQCDYFRCFFSGSWSDSSTNRIRLEGLDKQITIAGLNTVFGSLYQNEITFDLKDIGGIISSATLFNLVPCIERCEELMLNSIGDSNVVDYYELSALYGTSKCRDRCIRYMANMFWRLARSADFLKQLSIELFEIILRQSDLCVTEGERDIYNAIKNWVYIHETGTVEFTLEEVHKYVSNKPERYFYKYEYLLKLVRWEHMVTAEKTLAVLKTEHIVDKQFLSTVVFDQWTSMLLYEEKLEMIETIPDDIFSSSCRRVGRQVDEDKAWRWSGFDFGLDLFFRCQYGVISMLRNHSRDLTTQSLSTRKKVSDSLQIVCSQ